MRNSLLWRLVAINIPVIGVVILVVWLAIDILAADYFSVLMDKYNVSPTESHQMFIGAIRRYLIQASVVAMCVAVALSYFLTRAVLRPLQRIGEMTRRVAEGDYSARTGVETRDQIGQLARSFDQMADSLEQIEQLRKTMIVDMAHELRTPLTNVRGYLEGLADGVIPPTKPTLDMLQSEILRLVRLVNDLQQLTKAEAAEAYLQREEVDLAELVNQVLEIYRHDIERRRIAVVTDIPDGAGRVTADRDKILQAVSNLIQNACQYTPEGGSLRISSGEGAEGVTLSFANTGDPIDEKDLPLIFERFYRAEKSRSRDSGGAGFGLAIVKGLIEAHGGKVGATSAGDQTRIWFTLPA